MSRSLEECSLVILDLCSSEVGHNFCSAAMTLSKERGLLFPFWIHIMLYDSLSLLYDQSQHSTCQGIMFLILLDWPLKTGHSAEGLGYMHVIFQFFSQVGNCISERGYQSVDCSPLFPWQMPQIPFPFTPHHLIRCLPFATLLKWQNKRTAKPKVSELPPVTQLLWCQVLLNPA